MPGVDTEIVVVGAGVMGLATARALARSGRDVVVCEQFELGHARGSSHGTSRIVRLSYPEARWVRLAQESYPLWRELEAERGQTLLELRGTLDLGDWEPNRDALAACGVPFEVLERTELERRFAISADVGLFQADGGIVRADRALAALADGLAVRERTKAGSIEETDDGVAVGGLRARAVVVTAGAWAPELVGVDAVPTVETVSYFELEEPVPSVIETSTGPHPGYALASPGGVLKAGLHQSGPTADLDQAAQPDDALAAQTAAWVERRFLGAGAATARETCLYTTRAHDEFLLERRGRVVVGSACSGHGFKFAPVIGQRLAALALEAV
ncbi:MAG: FAD-dependent oxidoreductase [Thermoleophilia bacterium]|nr:FAD-dependent oxidoreductase [Thermoleophilia bacterium]